MRNIKLTIEYDGKKYLGWQRLGDSDKTIQGKIESVLSHMTGETVEIIGSGRTDAGTHATGQVANFKTNHTLTCEQILNFLNNQLPNDIVIKSVEEETERFHARYNAKGKTYRYLIWNSDIPTALYRNHSYHYANQLDVNAMIEAAELLEGEHDFIGFSSLKRTKKSTVRKIDEIKITQEKQMIRIEISGNGFLYNMVRIIVGTLLEIGAGTASKELIQEIFTNKVRAEAGKTVPAHGLYLDKVVY